MRGHTGEIIPMDRREFLRSGTSLLVPAVLVLAPEAGAQARWELRFLRVWQSVQVRVGGASGPLIQLSATPGQSWTNRDKNPSTPLDISKWVGNSPMIRLHARINAAQGSPVCVMQTLFGGVEKQHWSFDSQAYYEIKR